MTPQDTISAVVAAAALSYSGAMRNYAPWRISKANNRIIDERNITFYFCRAFANIIANAAVFLEVPFKVSGKSARLDAYCCSPTLGLGIEVKTFFDRPELEGILRDIERLTTKTMAQVRSRHSTDHPSEYRGLVLLETWGDKNRELWLGSETEPDDRECANLINQLRTAKTSGWIFAATRVGEQPILGRRGKDGAVEECHWLFGISPSLACGAA